MKNSICRILCVAFLFLYGSGANPLSAQSPDEVQERWKTVDELNEQLKKTLETWDARHTFPGITLGYIMSDGTSSAMAVGYSDWEEETLLKPEDKLLSGSIGKTYVAAVALQLVGEKKLDLDGKISQWLGEEEWFPRLPNSKEITVRMLMNHTSGITEHVYDPAFGEAVAADPDRVWKPAELLAYALDKEPRFPAGEDWAYADTNYIVLGMVMEKITGRPYYLELEERILKPLGLKETVPSDKRVIPGLVPGYASYQSPFKNKGKTVIDGKLVVNPQVEWTGGGLACTARDLAKWAWLLLHCKKAFPEDLREDFLDGQPAKTGEGDRYGLGVQIWNSDHGTCLGHMGWFPGYLAIMAYYPDLEIAVALQFNTDNFKSLGMHPRSYLDGLAGIMSE